jgi:hypothetical protein
MNTFVNAEQERLASVAEVWKREQERIRIKNEQVLNRICKPYNPSEVCEAVTESDE